MSKIVILRQVCLTNNTLPYLRFPRGWETRQFTAQRVDYALRLSENPDIAEPAEDYKKFFIGEEGVFLANQLRQSRNLFGEKNVAMMMLDSFSELFNTVFENKATGRQFCALYGHFDRKGMFADQYKDLGRLSAEEIEDCYRRFFAKFNAVYGAVPIVYLAFSHAFEEREIYKERGLALDGILTRLEAEFPNLHVYKLDFVEKNPEDSHRYHYSNLTYRKLAKRIAAREKEPSLKLCCPDIILRALHKVVTKRKLEGGTREITIFGRLTLRYTSHKKR